MIVSAVMSYVLYKLRTIYHQYRLRDTRVQNIYDQLVENGTITDMQSTLDITHHESMYSRFKKRVKMFSTPKDKNEDIAMEELPTPVSQENANNDNRSAESSLHGEETLGAVGGAVEGGDPLGITNRDTKIMDIVTSLEEEDFTQPEKITMHPRHDDYVVRWKLSTGAVYFPSYSASRGDIQVDNPNTTHPLIRTMPTADKRKKTVDFLEESLFHMEQ